MFTTWTLRASCLTQINAIINDIINVIPCYATFLQSQMSQMSQMSQPKATDDPSARRGDWYRVTAVTAQLRCWRLESRSFWHRAMAWRSGDIDHGCVWFQVFTGFYRFYPCHNLSYLFISIMTAKVGTPPWNTLLSIFSLLTSTALGGYCSRMTIVSRLNFFGPVQPGSPTTPCP